MVEGERSLWKPSFKQGQLEQSVSEPSLAKFWIRRKGTLQVFRPTFLRSHNRNLLLCLDEIFCISICAPCLRRVWVHLLYSLLSDNYLQYSTGKVEGCCSCSVQCLSPAELTLSSTAPCTQTCRKQDLEAFPDADAYSEDT